MATAITKIGFYECPDCNQSFYKEGADNRTTATCKNTSCDNEVTFLPNTVRKKAFGSFECKCGSTWSSAHTYAFTHQKCKKCQSETFAHHMKPLVFSGISSEDSPHLQELCGMCKKLGRRCFTSRSDDDIGLTESFNNLTIDSTLHDY